MSITRQTWLRIRFAATLIMLAATVALPDGWTEHTVVAVAFAVAALAAYEAERDPA